MSSTGAWLQVLNTATVAAAIGCRMEVLKVTRCSAAGPKMVDHLSKAKFREFRAEADKSGWHLQTAPAVIPKALLRWLDRRGLTTDWEQRF
jgi:hypothetical protein